MNRMKRVRTQQGLSQAQLSIKTGIHPSTLSRLECGVLKGNKIQWRKIGRVLGLQLDRHR